tara:strand:+ start:159 stop:758 length:600 start_codon:yes stop_codon:yes gene_type:complete
MKRKRLKFKKLLNEYRSRDFELQYVEEILKEADHEFEIYYRQYCANNNIDIAELNKQHAPRVENMLSSTAVDLAAINNTAVRDPYCPRKIFKDIARRLHPDKLSEDHPDKKKYEEDFKKATDAVQGSKWGELFSIVDEYNIATKQYDEINDALRRDIEKIEKIISKRKNSYSWLLFSCDGDADCMDNVVRKFLNHLFNI